MVVRRRPEIVPGRERVDERGALAGGGQVGQHVEAVGPGRAGAQQALDGAELDAEDAQHPVQRGGADHGGHGPQPLAGLAGGHAEPGGLAGVDQLVEVHQAAQRGADDHQRVALGARPSRSPRRSRRPGSRTAPSVTGVPAGSPSRAAPSACSSATGTGATIGASSERRCGQARELQHPVAVGDAGAVTEGHRGVRRVGGALAGEAAEDRVLAVARGGRPVQRLGLVRGRATSDRRRARRGTSVPPLIRNTSSRTPDRAHSSTSPPPARPATTRAGRTGRKRSSVIQQPSPCPVSATDSGVVPASRTASRHDRRERGEDDVEVLLDRAGHPAALVHQRDRPALHGQRVAVLVEDRRLHDRGAGVDAQVALPCHDQAPLFTVSASSSGSAARSSGSNISSVPSSECVKSGQSWSTSSRIRRTAAGSWANRPRNIPSTSAAIRGSRPGPALPP